MKSVEIAAFSTLYAPRHRLSDRLRHDAHAAAGAGGSGPAGHPAVLDFVSHPHLCLDEHPAARRPAQSAVAGAHIVREPPVWLSTNTAVYIGIVYSYLPFMVLPLYATLEKLDEIAPRSRRRSRLPALEDVLARNSAAVGAGRGRWRAAVLHSDRRRVRHSRSARRLAHGDDRPDDLDGIFRQQGLADRIGGRRRPGVPFGDADRDLPAPDDARRGARQ